MKNRSSVRKLSLGIGLGLVAMAVQAGPVFTSSSYAADVVFKDAGNGTTMQLAYDGTNYWSSNGGSSYMPYHQYDSAGNLLHTYTAAPDFRSLFSVGSDIYATSYANRTIYKQTGPGVFAAAVTLTGGNLDAQSSVTLNSNGAEYDAVSYGVVSRWDLNGNYLGTVTLNGWGSVAGETNYPAERGLVSVDGYWLTYSYGTLSAWDASGLRVDETTLAAGGTSFDSEFSFSYTNGRVFVVDAAGGNWRGYDLGFAPAVPEPETYAMMIAGLGLLGAIGRRRRQAA